MHDPMERDNWEIEGVMGVVVWEADRRVDCSYERSFLEIEGHVMWNLLVLT
jgi:hypothetical protein